VSDQEASEAFRDPESAQEAFADLLAAVAAVDAAQIGLRDAVIEARVWGYSWDAIAQAMGCSKQAAWERFRLVVGEPDER
jgi:DNA-directed RNA polymerase specialized sigma24 family protein